MQNLNCKFQKARHFPLAVCGKTHRQVIASVAKQTVFIYVREMIFTAKVQIILKPFCILPFQVVGDGLVPQTLFK
jgi:hypothetical protein